MDPNPGILKTLAKISLAALGALFILGVIFYKERVLFCDASFCFFDTINDGVIFPSGGRYGAFITRLLPYLGQKLHLPLRTLMMLYGMSFYLFFLAVAALIYGLKQYRLTILMALFYFLFASQSFIWISETYQGAAWMFLFFGITIHLGNRKAGIFLLLPPFILLAFLALYSHVLVMVPFAFLWIYFIIEKRNWPFSRNATIGLSGLLLAIVATKIIISMTGVQSSHDADSLHAATHFSLQDIIDSFNTPVIKMFLYRCLINYWLGIIVFIIGIINLIKNRQIALTTWTLLTGLGYFIIMGLTYGKIDGNFHLFHVESEWVCFGIIAATPWVFSFLPGRKPALVPWLLTGIFVIRLAYIGITIPLFSARIQMQDQVLGQMRKKGITKLALYNNRQLMSTNIDSWALPFESLMLSQSEGDKPQLTFFFVNRDDTALIQTVSNTKGIFNSWGIMQEKDFNKQYFETDTIHPYQVMTYEELMQ